VKAIAGAAIKGENQKQRLYGLITTAIESLPAQHNKDRVAEIAGEMFENCAREIEFFAAISVIGRAVSSLQKEVN
jgi:hypothetical protein